jgi:hypothetical protein
MPENMNTRPQRRAAPLETPPDGGHLRFAVPIEESEETVAVNHAAELAGISARFPGVAITVGEGWKTWHAEHGGCVHDTAGSRDTSGMGALQVELWRCVGGLG